MPDQRTLHSKRLREALEDISRFRAQEVDSWTPTFMDWRNGVIQSLEALHLGGYRQRFESLRFEEGQADLDPRLWPDAPSNTFPEDLGLAEKLIEKSLEDLPDELPAQSAPRRGHPDFAPPLSTQGPVNVTVNLNQYQTVNVNMAQYLGRLGDLTLPDPERNEAEKQLRSLAEEFKGPHRWEKMGPVLVALKAIGKGVYEQVALPLLAELARRAAGLP